ncbi:hypothetical protein B0H15DRAFT_798631 [Mycena belliarum]|uniref:Uncharacterized protein n=1 Tax=Mycena belliarum TaxID=1033014 RepID=A0AAD6UAB2_9AGAR|nr:hypothetical protein B0H15DRAFT_798631 [Mycena belliae]
MVSAVMRHIPAPTHLKLAQKYYAERVEELRTLITAEEQQFKAIVAEIDQIRAGQRDEEVEARITGISTPEREAEGEGGEATIAEGPEAVALEESAPVDTSNLISDEPPEVDMPVAEPHTSPQEEEITPSVAPPPSPPDASMEDVETRPEATTSPPSLCVESPPPEALSSPPENLDHLMQASDDESPGKPQTDDVPLPVLEEPVNVVPEQAEEMEQTKETQQAAEDEAEFMNEARPLTEDLPMETSEAVSAAPVEELTSELVDDVQVEVEVETETADEEMDRSQSKLESDDISSHLLLTARVHSPSSVYLSHTHTCPGSETWSPTPT